MLRRLIRLYTLCGFLAFSIGLIVYELKAFLEHFNPYLAVVVFVSTQGLFVGTLEIYLLKRNKESPPSDHIEAITGVYVLVDDEILETVRISLLSCRHLQGSHEVTVVCSESRSDVESLCHELGFTYCVGGVNFKEGLDQHLITNGHCILYPDAVIVASRRLGEDITFVELNHSIYSSHILGNPRETDDVSRASLISAAAGTYFVPVYTGGPILVKTQGIPKIDNDRDSKSFEGIIASVLSKNQCGTITSHPCCECLSNNEIDHNISSRISRYKLSRKLTQHSQYIDTAFGIIRHSFGWMYMRYFWVKTIAFILAAVLLSIGLIFEFPREILTRDFIVLFAATGVSNFAATYVRGDRRYPHERLRDVLLDCEALTHLILGRFVSRVSGNYRIQFIPFFLSLIVVVTVLRTVRYGKHISFGDPLFTYEFITMAVGLISIMALYRAMYRYLTTRQRVFARRKVSIPGSSSYESMWIVDLTHRGAAFITDVQLELGDETPLVFRIPTMSGDSLITVVGRVTYCAPHGSSYQVGVVFKEVSQSDLDDLMMYCSVIYPYHQARNIENAQDFLVGKVFEGKSSTFRERNYLSAAIYGFSLVVLASIISLSLPLQSETPSFQHSEKIESLLSNKPMVDSVNALNPSEQGAPSGKINNGTVVSLSSSIFRDDNFDGKQNNAESGIQGINVKLYTSDHIQVLLGVNGSLGDDDDSDAPLVSDSSGDINFRFIEPGTYYAVLSGVSNSLQPSDISKEKSGVQEIPSGYKTALFKVDSNENGNIAQLNIGFVQKYDLEISHAFVNEQQSGYLPGDVVRMAVTVKNNGPFAARSGYKITSVLSDDFDEENISMRATAGFSPCGFSGLKMECVSNRELLPGESKTVEFEVTSHVSASSASNRREITSYVSNSLKAHREAQGSMANNSFTSVLPVGHSASIGDRVFLDANSNGEYDAGELGIPGVRVGLRQFIDTNGDGYKDPGETREIAHDVSDVNGYFGVTNGKAGFQNLTAGQEFALTFSSLPKGFVPTIPMDKKDDDDGRDNVLYTTEFKTLSANTIDLSRDLAVAAPQKDLSTILFLDRDRNSRFDKSEAFFQGYDIRLLRWIDANNDGRRDNSEIDESAGYATISKAGKVTFGSVPDALVQTKYAIEIDITDGYEIVDGSKPFNNRMRSRWMSIREFAEPIAILETGTSIKGTIYIDFNGNNKRDKSEYGISMVTVVVLNENKKVIANAVTNSSGEYVLKSLPTGSFSVGILKSSTPQGFLEKSIGSKTLTRNLYGDPDLSIVLTAQHRLTSYDMVLVPVADINGKASTVRGHETIPIENSAITLLSDGTLAARVHSDSQGKYGFKELVPGIYDLKMEHTTSAQTVRLIPGKNNISDTQKYTMTLLDNIFRGQFDEIQLTVKQASALRNILVAFIIFNAAMIIMTLFRRKKLISRSLE